MSGGGSDSKGSLTPREQNLSWQNLWREEPSLEKDGTSWKGTRAVALHERQPLQRTYVGEILGGPTFLWRDPTLEQGKCVRSPPPEEEGAAETM